LADELYALVFFLGGEVGHVVFDEFGPDAVGQGLAHLDDAVELLDGDFVGFAGFDFV